MSDVSEILRFLFSTLAVYYLKVISFERCVNFAGELAYQRSYSLVLSVYVQIIDTDSRVYVQFVSYVYIYIYIYIYIYCLLLKLR